MSESKTSATVESHNPGITSESLGERLIDALTEIAELRAELRVSLKALDEKIDRVLDLEKLVHENERQLVRIKTVWSLAAGAIALAVTFLKDMLFGDK